MSQKESEWEKSFEERFDDMNRRCDVEYGTGQFPPKVKRFFIDSIATAVSTREKEIAEEVEKILKNYKVKEEPLCEQNALIKIIEGRILSILKH